MRAAPALAAVLLAAAVALPLTDRQFAAAARPDAVGPRPAPASVLPDPLRELVPGLSESPDPDDMPSPPASEPAPRPTPARKPRRTRKPPNLASPAPSPDVVPTDDLGAPPPTRPSPPSARGPDSTPKSPNRLDNNNMRRTPEPPKDALPKTPAPARPPPMLSPPLETPDPSFSPESPEPTLLVPGESPSDDITASPDASPAASPESGFPPEGLDPGALPPIGPINDSPRTTCFPAGATVALEGGRVVRMRDLRVGDRVQVASGRFAHVHVFTHRLPHAVSPFVRLTTASGRVLTVSGGHFVYVGHALRKARDVRVGDRLPTAEGGWTAVTHIAEVLDTGLYNPHTAEGDVVVNGIRTSVYTEAMPRDTAHAALAPLRMLYSVFGLAPTLLESGYPRFIPLPVREKLITST